MRQTLIVQGNHATVDDLYAELQDGTKLLYLLEVLTDQKIVSATNLIYILYPSQFYWPIRSVKNE